MQSSMMFPDRLSGEDCELGDKPLVANVVEGGRTPIMSSARLAEIGYALAIYPVAGLLSAARGDEHGLFPYSRHRLIGRLAPLYSFADMNRLMGFEEVWAFDRAHAEI
jgi:2,3-dimethylmalate lyase